MTKKITKFWPINKILEAVPEAVDIMREIGLHCFGCSSSNTELLHQGMAAHGFSTEETDTLVEKLNKLLREQNDRLQHKPADQDFIITEIKEANKTYFKIAGVLFTEFALNTLHEMLEDLNGLQIRLDPGGCSGFTYTYDFVNDPREDEKTYKLSDKLNLYMNDFTFDKLHGTIIDFKIGIKDAGLKFNNPNTKDSCHCGTSVGF
jgi:iron-sulfur cluster assembly protein